MPKIPFPKPALPLGDQLALMTGRGLIVPDEAAARGYLENISYYRLSGYSRFFTDPADDKSERFRPGVTMDDVIDLYVFDRKLRVHLSEAFERIEVAVKDGLAYHGAMVSGPFWMSEPANFDHGSHNKIMDIITEACGPQAGKHPVFLEAFYAKYVDPVPPAWMITEVLSFGAASVLYKHAKGPIRMEIARQFDLQQDILESWLHALSFTRNVCAHHMRLWNKTLTIAPKIPRVYQGRWGETHPKRVYVICCLVNHLLQRVGGETSWPTRLRELIANKPKITLAMMGFPDDWEARNFWVFP